MEDERDVAVRALPGAPAGSAAKKRRPAAPVEQDDRLGAPLANLGQRLPDARVERAGNGRAARGHRFPGGRRPPRPAAGRPRRRAAVAEAVAGQPALGPRRCAAGDQRGSGFGRPPPGDLAGVVARIALLLVGGVVLLVDHHQAQVAHRGEGRRARPDADPRFAGLQALPLVAALARGQPRSATARLGRRTATRTATSPAASARSPGRARSRPCPAEAPPRWPPGRPRSCPSPVTPCRRCSRGAAPSIAATTGSSAAFCSAVSRGLWTGRRRRRPSAAGSCGRCAA